MSEQEKEQFVEACFGGDSASVVSMMGQLVTNQEQARDALNHQGYIVGFPKNRRTINCLVAAIISQNVLVIRQVLACHEKYQIPIDFTRRSSFSDGAIGYSESRSMTLLSWAMEYGMHWFNLLLYLRWKQEGNFDINEPVVDRFLYQFEEETIESCFTLLHWAVEKHNSEAVRLLLSLGADVNRRTVLTDPTTGELSSGRTARELDEWFWMDVVGEKTLEPTGGFHDVLIICCDDKSENN